jgi:hypothetical protein
MAKRSRDTALETALAEHKECTHQLLSCLDQQTKLRALKSRTETQEVELAGLEKKISVLTIAQETCRNVIALNAAPTKENDKNFSNVDRVFIEKVTGTNLDWRPWEITDQLHGDIVPPANFKELFESNSAAFAMCKEAGRRTVFDMFLRAVVTVGEFRSQLRIFPEFEYSVTQLDESSQPLSLSGKADYTIGHSCGRDIFDKEPPKEVHLVACEAKRDGLEENFWQCVAQAAALHKARKVAGKVNKKVWGILSNATLWKFIYIDDSGNLYTSKDFTLTLRRYDIDEVHQIFRCIHHIVKSCFEASPPPSPERSR